MVTRHDLSAWITPSAHTIHLLLPHVPRGYDAWDSFYVLLAMALFKFYRGRKMQTRAYYIDRFGWSIILFDYVFGTVFTLSTLFACYPGLHVSIWIDRFFLNLLLTVTIWQALEIQTADYERVKAAASGIGNGSPPYDGTERRSTTRRAEDRALKARNTELETLHEYHLRESQET